jgi:hypothetical protein
VGWLGTSCRLSLRSTGLIALSLLVIWLLISPLLSVTALLRVRRSGVSAGVSILSHFFFSLSQLSTCDFFL